MTRCRWKGENRGWCVRHDSEWRIDRSRCESVLSPESEQSRLVRDIRVRLPFVAIGYPDLAAEIGHALDRLEEVR